MFPTNCSLEYNFTSNSWPPDNSYYDRVFHSQCDMWMQTMDEIVSLVQPIIYLFNS